MKFLVCFLVALAFTEPACDALAQTACTPPAGGKCLTKDQLDKVEQALKELDAIHKAPAVITTPDTITIIHDWQNRVFVNGGGASPVRLKLKLGDTVDRDMAVTLPTQVYFRPQPPDPMFRLRIRAQAGILVPQLLQTATGNKQSFWDAGIGWDFFHYNAVNVAVYTGVRSVGGGIGLDLTRNFGPYVGYSLVYEGLQSSVQTGIYFSFN